MVLMVMVLLLWQPWLVLGSPFDPLSLSRSLRRDKLAMWNLNEVAMFVC